MLILLTFSTAPSPPEQRPGGSLPPVMDFCQTRLQISRYSKGPIFSEIFLKIRHFQYFLLTISSKVSISQGSRSQWRFWVLVKKMFSWSKTQFLSKMCPKKSFLILKLDGSPFWLHAARWGNKSNWGRPRSTLKKWHKNLFESFYEKYWAFYRKSIIHIKRKKVSVEIESYLLLPRPGYVSKAAWVHWDCPQISQIIE